VIGGNFDVFQTSQDLFKDGTGTYTIEITETVNLVDVGTVTYGFDWVLSGFVPRIEAETFGYGKVDVPSGGNFPEFNPFGGGTIDCGFQLPMGETPITASPWTVTGDTGISIEAITIKNVGLWTLVRNATGMGQQSIDTNNFSMYPAGGQLHMRGLAMTVDFHGTLDPPRATLGGTSAWRYVTFGESRVDFGELTPVSTLEFVPEGSVAGALVRPRGALASDPDYPTSVPSGPPPSLELDFDNGVIDIHTRVTREGKRFDTSYVDLFSKVALTIESAAVDTCNLQFMDFLLPDPNPMVVPLSCFSKNNRCNKSWGDLHLTIAPNTLTLVNNRVNHTPDYNPLPAGPPPEAVYFCDTETSAMPTVITNGLRMYARSKDQPSFPAILIVLSRYGDFEADFDVDLVDFARFQNCFTGMNTEAAPNAHATWYPLADWGSTATNLEADADVDLHDYAVMQQRWHSSGTGYQVCATPPTDNEDMANGDPDIIVCGGPLHVRPDDAPELDCPPCSAYNYVPTCESGFAGGGGESMAMAGGGMELIGGEDEAEALAFFDGEPVEVVPEYGLSAEVLAEALLASLPPGELASFAAQLASDAEASGDTVAAAVAQLLN